MVFLIKYPIEIFSISCGYLTVGNLESIKKILLYYKKDLTLYKLITILNNNHINIKKFTCIISTKDNTFYNNMNIFYLIKSKISFNIKIKHRIS